MCNYHPTSLTDRLLYSGKTCTKQNTVNHIKCQTIIIEIHILYCLHTFQDHYYEPTYLPYSCTHYWNSTLYTHLSNSVHVPRDDCPEVNELTRHPQFLLGLVTGLTQHLDLSTIPNYSHIFACHGERVNPQEQSNCLKSWFSISLPFSTLVPYLNLINTQDLQCRDRFTLYLYNHAPLLCCTYTVLLTFLHDLSRWEWQSVVTLRHLLHGCSVEGFGLKKEHRIIVSYGGEKKTLCLTRSTGDHNLETKKTDLNLGKWKRNIKVYKVFWHPNNYSMHF